MWWAFLLRGVLALALSVSALIWPKLTLRLLVRLIGIYALLDGPAGLSGRFRSELRPYLALALLSVAVGAILLFWPGKTVRWLLVLLGLFVLGLGASLLRSGYQARQADPNRSLLLTTGSVAAVIGLVLIVWRSRSHGWCRRTSGV